MFASTGILASILATGTHAYLTPPLDYAFTISSYNQATGPPQALPGSVQVSGIGLNSTICGPLLNASLVSFSFSESLYSKPVNYSTSTAAGIYQTDDGYTFPWYQLGAASNHSDVASFYIDIGGPYAYLRQYIFVCYTPITTGSDFHPTSTSGSATPTPSAAAFASAPAVAGVADCFVLGGL